MSADEVRTEYMKRNNISTVTNEDERLIKAIVNLRKNYANELEKRKTVLLIEHNEVFNEPVIKQEIQKPSVVVHYCKAIKMDGNKCTAKAKPNCEFCGRHLPKTENIVK